LFASQQIAQRASMNQPEGIFRSRTNGNVNDYGNGRGRNENSNGVEKNNTIKTLPMVATGDGDGWVVVKSRLNSNF
jgi:hypothetical protein